MSTFQRLYDVIVEGNAKYGANTGQDVDWEDHLSHAQRHVTWARDLSTMEDGDTILAEDLDTHLNHALCRLIYAIECRELQEARYTPTSRTPDQIVDQLATLYSGKGVTP